MHGVTADPSTLEACSPLSSKPLGPGQSTGLARKPWGEDRGVRLAHVGFFQKPKTDNRQMAEREALQTHPFWLGRGACERHPTKQMRQQQLTAPL